MDENDTLYGGIAGVELPIDEFDFGNGITIRRTYCYIFAPFMAAFVPAPSFSHHPGPWRSVGKGFSFEIKVELELPAAFDPGTWFDRPNTIWWFTALLRLKCSPSAITPVIASQPFNKMAHETGGELVPAEIFPHRLAIDVQSDGVTEESLSWIKVHWRAAGELMSRSEAFNVAISSFDECASDRSPAVALVTLWGALERLFAPAHQELTFRVSANIAAYLEPQGESRFSLYKRVKKLYGERSKAAHGAGARNREPFIETYNLLRRVLLKMIDSGHVPSRDELESLMFT